MEKSPDAFRTISEVADFLETPAHVLRFWESRFPQIRPVKRAGGRRYYRPADVALLSGIRRLLHDEGMTIRGVQKILREQGVRHVAGLSDAENTVAETLEAGFDAGLDEAPEAAPEAAMTARVVSLSDWVGTVEAEASAATVASETPEVAPEISPPSTERPETERVFPATRTEDAETGKAAAPGGMADEPAAPAPDVATAPEAGAAALSPDSFTDDPAQDVVATAAPGSGEHRQPAPEQPAAGAGKAAAESRPKAVIGKETEALWLPTLLRGLAPGALDDRQAALRPLHTRLKALRDRMAEASRAPRS